MQDQVLKNIMEPEAMERLNRIQFVKPEKYQQIKGALLAVRWKEILIGDYIDENQWKSDDWNVVKFVGKASLENTGEVISLEGDLFHLRKTIDN